MNYEVLIKQSEGRAGHNGEGKKTPTGNKKQRVVRCGYSWREKQSREVEEEREAESESEEVESTEWGKG